MSQESYLSEEELAALDAEMTEHPTEEAASEALLKRAAALAASGAGKTMIGKKLSLTPYAVNKLYRNDRFKQLLDEIGNDAVASAKNELKQAISKMAKKTAVAIEKNLEKHSLEAAKVVLKAMGLDAGQEDVKSGGFTLVLADNKPQAPAIEVVDERKEE